MVCKKDALSCPKLGWFGLLQGPLADEVHHNPDLLKLSSLDGVMKKKRCWWYLHQHGPSDALPPQDLNYWASRHPAPNTPGIKGALAKKCSITSHTICYNMLWPLTGMTHCLLSSLVANIAFSLPSWWNPDGWFRFLNIKLGAMLWWILRKKSYISHL